MPVPVSPPPDAELRAAKRALRAAVLATRDALPPDTRRFAAKAIVRALLATPSFSAARTVLLTLPFGSEWDTRPIALAALAAGKTVVLPRVDAARRRLDLGVVRDLDTDVIAGYRGIPEPRPETEQMTPAELDWVLVPGLAFDLAGGRLGYGGGYYDRLLAELHPNVPRVAGLFALQVVTAVPTGSLDRPVDCLVTETSTRDVHRR